MAFGFMGNEAVVAGIGDFYDATKGIKLVGEGALDPYALVGPQAGFYSQLDLVLTVQSGTPRCLKTLLTWNAAGSDPAFRETDKELIAVGPGGSMVVVPIASTARSPSSQTVRGEIWLWLKVDSGLITVSRARLQWADTMGGR